MPSICPQFSLAATSLALNCIESIHGQACFFFLLFLRYCPMKIQSKRNLLQVDGNYFAGYNLQSMAALPTHQRLLPLDKHVCASLGHVFVFSQTAFWRTKEKTEQICVSALAWEWRHTAAFPYHSDGVGQCWSSSTNWRHTSLLCLETNCSPSQQIKPAESTDTVLPKSEEIKWQQNWTSFFTYKTSTKKVTEKLQRYGIHTFGLCFPPFW